MLKPEWYSRYKWTGFVLFMLGMLDLLLGKTLVKSLSGASPGAAPGDGFTAVTASTIILLAAGIILFSLGAWLERQWESKTGHKRTSPSPFLKIWVWLHVIIITIKCLPSAPDDVKGDKPKRAAFGTEYLLLATDKLEPMLDVYLWPTGFWQDWAMFAPNPSDWDGYTTAQILYKDGSKKTYKYPRMLDLGLGIKYFKERYRKFLERAHSEKFAWLWPQYALRIAIESYNDPANPPVGIQLWRHWLVVPPTITFPDYLSGVWKAVSTGKPSMDAFLPANPKMPAYNHYRYLPDPKINPDPNAFWPIDEKILKGRARL
ncbi:MAG: hypothetical protein WAO58_10715 [Fimbriimonadaceae bacterium]